MAGQLTDGHIELDDLKLPAYADLPRGVSGAGSAWGLFGPQDGLGLVNLQTPARRARAFQVPKKGKVFSLSAPIDMFEPPFFPGRSSPRHTVIRRNPRGFDDVIDNFYPQASSQWDGLGHVGAADGVFYGGATAQEVSSGARNSIDAWARSGIVGRGVLLDVSGALATRADGKALSSSVPITVADLEEARLRTGLSFEPGDILLVHTGFMAWYESSDLQTRQALVEGGLHNAGLARCEEMAAYLWDLHVCAVAMDNVAIEDWPPDRSPACYPFGFMHQVLIGEFGMALGELWRLADLAADCQADGSYECLVVSAPLTSRAGTGSPANALALK